MSITGEEVSMSYTGTQLGRRQGELAGTLTGTKQTLVLKGGRNGDCGEAEMSPLLAHYGV